MENPKFEERYKKILQGDQLTGARLIRQLEEGEPEGFETLKLLYPHTGKALVVAITGPAGSGKSTIVNGVISEFRQKGMKVGVVAIDPSSPISGGALLGDRIRMRHHTEDSGVFIRSMATRGHLGGLSKATRETVLVIDAMGYDIIVIETVGVGQDEVDVAEFAHTTTVVSIPGMGDDIQAMKAGLLEIGNVFVVNKADNPGADDVAEQLRIMLEMSATGNDDWSRPVVKTVASQQVGIAELVDIFWKHRQYLLDSGKFGEHNFKWEFLLFRQYVMELAADRLFDCAEDTPVYRALLQDLKIRQIDPFSAAEQLIKGLRCKF